MMLISEFFITSTKLSFNSMFNIGYDVVNSHHPNISLLVILSSLALSLAAVQPLIHIHFRSSFLCTFQKLQSTHLSNFKDFSFWQRYSIFGLSKKDQINFLRLFSQSKLFQSKAQLKDQNKRRVTDSYFSAKTLLHMAKALRLSTWYGCFFFFFFALPLPLFAQFHV